MASVTDRERVHVTIRGRVQGVGFRTWTAHQGELRGLTGWVRNRADGSVEAVIAGPVDAVEFMLKACGQGPHGSRVDELEIHARTKGPPPPEESKGFAVRD
jgi:acylphosphatase